MQGNSIKVDSLGTSNVEDSARVSAVTAILSKGVENEEPVKIFGEVKPIPTDRYKIYSTPNMYNFLKLDTMTGRIDRVQWAFEDKKRYETPVNNNLLISFSDQWVNGRFEIYQTTNIYNFLLLDKIDGRVWHCQWGFESGKTWIERIY